MFPETGLRDWLAGLNYQERIAPAIVRDVVTALSRRIGHRYRETISQVSHYPGLRTAAGFVGR